MAAAAKVETEKKSEVITAVYKVNLHCQKCAHDIRKPLLATQGVHSVETDVEKGEIKVKGVIDVIKIHKLVKKLSKKKVELVSPQVKITEKKETISVKEIKPAPKLRTTSVKAHLHCDKCEKDLRQKLLKHKDIYSVKTDMKAQTLTVDGTIESDKLLNYMRKKVHKNAEIITSKPEKKELEKKSEVNEVEKKGEEKKSEKKEVEKKEKSTETVQVVEFKPEKKVEVKTKEGNAPYFIHYVYAPQLFSDENPNACFIM